MAGESKSNAGAPLAHREALKDKFGSRSAVVGVVGLGYVGLPLGLAFAETDYQVIGFDIDSAKIEAIENAQSYFNHIPNHRIDSVSDRFFATTDYARISEVDVVILCVPTPLTANREPDLQFVEGSLEQVLPHLTAGQMLCLESTTYPGTTREKLAPRLVESGFSLGEDFFLAYSPEREDPGNEHFGMSDIPKVCAGMTENCLDVVTTLYASVVRVVVPVSSLDVAEMTKLLENVHRAVNIGLANEMKVVADAMDIDIYEVIEAAATKPFGFVPYYPGPGLGGHCIPIDPYYLTWRAKQIGVDTRFVELAGEINNSMPIRVIEKTIAALERVGTAVASANILVLGVAYKRNVSDTRESPAMKIIQLLEAEGAKVHYSDPLVPVMPKLRDYDFSHRSLDLTPDLLSRHDCVLLITDHDSFDYALIEKHARILIDTRGRYRDSARPVVSA